MEGENLGTVPTENISINSIIKIVNTRFHIQEILKQSDFSTHCIAQDIEVDLNLNNFVKFYFLKQNIYTKQAEFQYALTYYQKLQSYCKQPLAKADIIKLYHIFYAEDLNTNKFELVLLFERGESDRIDIDQIKIQQITKFMKNICILLQDLKSKVDLYHGNISIKNIVLNEDELKLSGFKPLFVSNPKFQTWKTDLCKKYTPYRLDLYMIGLIWLKMLGSDIEKVTKTCNTIEELSNKISQKYEDLPDEKKTNIVFQFLDLKNRSNLNLEDSILLIDEYFILETRKLMENENNKINYRRKSQEFEGGSVSDDGKASIGQSNYDSTAKEENPFAEGLRDSAIDNFTFNNDDFEKKETFVSDDRIMVDTNLSNFDNRAFLNNKNHQDSNLIEVEDQRKINNRQSELIQNSHDNEISVPKKDLLLGSENGIITLEGLNENPTGNSTSPSSQRSTPLNTNKDLLDAQRNPNSEPTLNLVTKQNHKRKTNPQGFAKKKSPNETKIESRNSINKTDSKEKEGSRTRKSKESLRKSSDRKNERSKNKVKPNSEVAKNEVGETEQKTNIINKELNDTIDKVATYMQPKSPIKPKIINTKFRPLAQDIRETSNQKSDKQINLLRPKHTQKEKLANLKLHLETISLPLNYHDHERNIVLHGKKETSIAKLPLELTEEQKERVQQEIELERQKRIRSDREKLELNKLILEQRHNATILEHQKIRSQIQSMLEKKKTDKKHIVNKAPSQDLDKTTPITKHEGGHKTDEESSELKNKDESLPLKPRSKSKNKKACYKSITKQTEKIPQPVQFSNFTQKEELFTYNNDLQNRNIGFKKVVSKLETFSKTSRSSSPNVNKTITSKTVNEFSPYKTQIDHGNFGVEANASQMQTGNLGQSPMKSTRLLKNEQTDNFVLSERYRSASLPNNEYLLNIQQFPIFEELDKFDPKDEQKKKNSEAQQTIAKLLRENDESKAYKYLEDIKNELSYRCLIKIYKQFLTHADSKQNQNEVKRILIDLYESMTTWPQIDISIIQAIIMAIATLEAHNNNFENVLNILKSPIFNGLITDPASHEELTKQAFTNLGKNLELAEYYEKQIDKSIADSFKNLDVAKLFVSISQVLECLNSTNENIRIAKFYKKVMAILQKIKKLNSNLKLKDQDYENLVECFVLNTARFANQQSNYNLSNFVIGEAIKNDHLDFAHNFNEDERKEYAALIQDFCWHLKDLPNYGTYKDNYIKYLTYAKNILKNCDLNAANLKLSLMINFNRGVFYLKEENQKKAYALFDKCLITYYAFFKEADQDLYVVLFNLGQAVYKKGKYSEAVYFFNRVLDEQCKTIELKEKSQKKLGFIFFSTEQYKNSMTILKPYLDANFEKRPQKSFYKSLSIYFLCCKRSESEEFSQFFRRLSQLSSNDLDQELYWYFKTYKSIQKIHEDHHNFKENKKYLQLIEEVICGSEGKDLAARRLLNIGGLIAHNFINASPEKIKDATELLIKQFHDFYMTVEENSICLTRYINNLLMIFLHSIPLFNERIHNHQFRQTTYEKIRRSIPKPVLIEVVSRMVKINATKNENIPDSLFTELESEPSHKEKAGKLPKLPSEKILENPKLDIQDCVCRVEFQQNPILQNLVKAFLKQIKNMLFLDIVENILTYYLRFEKSLVEIGLNYQKYNYIKQLIRFHLSKGLGTPVDKTKFIALLDQLFVRHNICIHDLKLIIVILEAFKDVTYLKLFSLYIDQYHSSHATVVFKCEFYDQFIRKSEGVTKRFFEQLTNYKFYELENCYFMHHLDSQNFIHIDKQFQFKLFLRSRHDLMNDPAFRDTFSKYVQVEDLHVFDLKYYLYTTVVKLIKKEDEAPLDILIQFQTKFLDSLNKIGSDEEKISVMIYEVLLLCNLFKFTSDIKPVEIFINIIEFIIQKFHFNLNFQFSRVLSLMGNIFFKFRNFEKCLHLKSQALTLMGDESKINLSEPSIMLAENKEIHLHHILSFMVICHLELSNAQAAAETLEKLESMKTTDQNIQFNRLILKCLVTLELNKITESLKVVYECIAMFGKMKLNVFLNRMYQAILDKATFMVISKTENNLELEVITRKSKTSISRLYELQI